MDDSLALPVMVEQSITDHFRAQGHEVQVTATRSALGWINLRVISDSFVAMSDDERETCINEALSRISRDLGSYPFSNYMLLTSEEAQLDQEALATQLPLWSEVLLRPDTQDACLPSPHEQTGPLVCTFYSFKGGVGRTTALAITAGLLAETGKRIVMIDFDLEAPGLSAMLDPVAGQDSKYGVLDYVYQRWLTPDQDIPTVADCIRRVGRSDLDLFLVPAGTYDDMYIHKLADFDVEKFYRR